MSSASADASGTTGSPVASCFTTSESAAAAASSVDVPAADVDVAGGSAGTPTGPAGMPVDTVAVRFCTARTLAPIGWCSRRWCISTSYSVSRRPCSPTTGKRRTSRRCFAYSSVTVLRPLSPNRPLMKGSTSTGASPTSSKGGGSSVERGGLSTSRDMPGLT